MPSQFCTAFRPGRYWRGTWAGLFLTLLGLRCLLGQEPAGTEESPPPRAAPANQRQTGLSVPASVTPTLGDGQVLEVRTAAGESTALLYADFGPQKLVVLPTGEMEMLAASRVRDTDQPLGRPSKNAMRQALKAAGFGDFKVELAKPYVFVYACSDAFYLQTRIHPHVHVSGRGAAIDCLGLALATALAAAGRRDYAQPAGL